jgi:hypothetical protein
MLALKFPVMSLTPVPSVAVPVTKRSALVPFPTAVRIIGDGPKGVSGEHDWPDINPAQSVFELPGPNEVNERLRTEAGIPGNVTGTPASSDAGVIAAPPLMSTGWPGVNMPGLPANVTLVPVPTSVDPPVVSFSVKVIPVGVTVTVPLPPVFSIPTTVANDGVAVNKMRPKPDPIKLNRAKRFIGFSWLND